MASFATCLLCHFLHLSPFHCPLKGLWRNGSASDSRSEGWEFESLWPRFPARQNDSKSFFHGFRHFCPQAHWTTVLSYETGCWPLQLLGEGFMLPFLFAHLKTAHHSQSARVIKGVDLSSTAGNCAWVQTPWLTLSPVQASCLTPSTSQVHGYFTVSLKSSWPHPCRSDAACLCQVPRLFQNAHTSI